MTSDNHISDQIIQNAISDALESERQRLASHLRDNIIEQVNLIQSQVSAYQVSAHPQSQMAFSVVSTLIQQLLQQVYNLESNLNPTTLQSLGLVAAIEAFANQQRRMTGVHITLNIEPSVKRLPLHIELALFRYVQDCVEEAVSERSSSQITISLEAENEQFALIISENGQHLTPKLKLAGERLLSLNADLQSGKSRYGGLETGIILAIETPVELTDRETDVIRLLSQGLTNKEIAYQLDIKPRTIKFHLDNIYSKLNVSTRTEAAIYALQHGLTN